jgi:trans-aconitate methyltransferase
MMELTTAIALIRDGVPLKDATVQTWADLGAGSGLFTLALASLLPPDSNIYAVDSDRHALQAIPWNQKDKSLIRVVSDVTHDLELPSLDGVLMANVLHFLPEHHQFLQRIRGMLADRGSIIIVEYDTNTGNRWVPYPISLDRMKALASAGHFAIKQLGREKSKFGGSIYSVLLSRL